MSRPSQKKHVYVQAIPGAKYLSPDFGAIKIIYVQTFVRSKAFVRSSCVQKTLCTDFRSKLPMSRLWWVQNFLYPDFGAFKTVRVQTLACSKLPIFSLTCVQKLLSPDVGAFIFLSRLFNYERTTPPGAFISVWTYRLLV